MFSFLRRQDWILNFSILATTSIGLVVLLSISKDLFIQQLISLLIGFGLILVLSYFDWRSLISHKWFIAGTYLFSILLLLITYLFAPPIRGVKSWLVLGPVQFQVSELAKLSIILLLAYFFSREHIGIARFSTMIRPIIYFLIPAFLIFLQPDMGTVVILSGIFVGFLLISGLKGKHILIGLIALSVLGFAGWNGILEDYQRERVIGLFQPEYDPLGVNYSTIQSKIAIGSGGVVGKGFNQGTQIQLGFLPEASTDYIFSSVVEEWGLVGGVLIIGLFSLMIVRIILIGYSSESNFYRFISLGAVMMFLVQFAINMGSALALLPVIGVTFPFLSYGGSSLIVNAVIIGVIQSGVVKQ
ncbi:MAG: hypothetical protein COU06_02125 [Candidatus Harrisonbacteria bacterium CG10_big_fil_rev_8_21_14_0_10_38_8]|uniref:Rod shape-determining protein RodA n=1 Tax=Candidatus Harrisonbacteria bacterium CG10_big_fil_rev_8_21_14_0_10_38_8 TaxID=1974582 RepID=A0A2M6WJR8_9BACT|nr:MAG: hypothetical protein COU06_02125 [Candidatus Harrisonbacteria bacterium CG10_big_fil_rev_8_21_14_0_10_38_8]